jgi:hypothetical protein
MVTNRKKIVLKKACLVIVKMKKILVFLMIREMGGEET